MPTSQEFSVNKSSECGVVQLLLLVILIAGIIAGIYLVQQTQIFTPKASDLLPVSPETSFSLIQQGKVKCPNILNFLPIPCPKDLLDDIVIVNLYARSDIEEANLFSAKLNFPKDLLEILYVQTISARDPDIICSQVVTKACEVFNPQNCKDFPTPCDVPAGWYTGQTSKDPLQTNNGFINNWVEQSFDDSSGTISLVGGVPAPGFKSIVSKESPLMATIFFRVKKEGLGKIDFDDSSTVYSNSNNINILTIKRALEINTSKPSPTQIPSPTLLQSWNYQKDYSGIQGKNNLYYLAYIKSKATYSEASFDGTNWQFSGADSDRNFLIEGFKIAPSWLSHAVIRWKAPQAGNISLNGYFQRCCSEPGDFNHKPYTIFSIHKNNTELWNKETEITDKYNYSLSASVSAGDNIEFWVDANNDSGWDGTWMDFTISYISSLPVVPLPGSGDGNGDGTVDLRDMSILLTDFNKKENIRKEIDMNGDGIINTLDYVFLRNLLVEKGVIRDETI